jgi:hypothetical protein
MCSCYAFICHAHITFRSDHIQITFICHAHSQITFICHAHINLVYSDGTCCKSSHSLPFPLRMVTCRRYQFQMTTQHTTLWHSDSSELWCIVWVSTCRNHMSDTFIFRCHIQLCMHIHMAYSDSRFRLSFTFAMSCYIHMHIFYRSFTFTCHAYCKAHSDTTHKHGAPARSCHCQPLTLPSWTVLCRGCTAMFTELPDVSMVYTPPIVNWMVGRHLEAWAGRTSCHKLLEAVQVLGLGPCCMCVLSFALLWL